jgi:hypothetical protein
MLVPRAFGGDPPHDVELALVTVGVLDRELCLAHPAHAVDRLGKDRGGALPQPLTEQFEQFQTAREVGVARRDVPPDTGL